MDGYFTATGFTGSDGRFDLPSEMWWKFFLSLGDPGCAITISAAGYLDSKDRTLCGPYWNLRDVGLIPN